MTELFLKKVVKDLWSNVAKNVTYRAYGMDGPAYAE